MQSAKSWGEVIDLVQREDTGKWDIEKSTKDLHLDDAGRLVLESREGPKPVRLSDLAMSQLCGKLELPSRYIKRIPTELQARCINHDLAQGRSHPLESPADLARWDRPR